MRNSIGKSRLSVSELIFFLVGAILLLLLASVLANGQSAAPLYREYRGVRLGMTAAEVRTKLGEPALKSDEQDFYVISTNETVQIAYNAAQKVMTISTDYTGGVGAPDYRNVVGEGMLLTRPDGTVFKMVMNDADRFWVTYSKSATTSPIITITIGAYK